MPLSVSVLLLMLLSNDEQDRALFRLAGGGLARVTSSTPVYESEDSVMVAIVETCVSSGVDSGVCCPFVDKRDVLHVGMLSR